MVVTISMARIVFNLFIYDLYKEAASVSEKVLSTCRMLVNNELERYVTKPSLLNLT
jgi:hypothetical protein